MIRAFSLHHFDLWLKEFTQRSIDLRRTALFTENSSRNVFLSPHLDDVCFSLGSAAHKLQAGVLLNVFTRSAWAPELDAPDELLAHLQISKDEADRLSKSLRPAAPARWVDLVSDCRKKEDRAFAAACRLDIVNLDLWEAPLRGRDCSGHPTEEDQEKVDSSLMAALANLDHGRGDSKRPWLFCPIGIGGHVDHLLVRDTILKHLPDLQTRYQIGFYEDLPYACDKAVRCRHLRTFFKMTGGRTWDRLKLPICDGYALKQCLIRLYPSQTTPADATVARFNPASLVGNELHEALWVLRA